MDAIDTALVELGGATPRLITTASSPWPSTLRERIQDLAVGRPMDATGFALLDAEVGESLADVINTMLSAAAVSPAQVTAIGCHGQTVAHTPDSRPRTTLQLGDANVVAERTGITTVSDFRRRDMAAGGQGAPLAPAFHAAFLRDKREDRVVLNLGGIANITILPADARQPASGFDTGPANCLMNAWAQQQLGKDYDEGGAWAASTQADPGLLETLLDDAFFSLEPPKSTGTQHFSAGWLDAKLAKIEGLPPACVQATLMALTCQSVADAIHRNAPNTKRVLVCGGGTRNGVLLRRLADVLRLPVESTAGLGIDPDWMEAMAFAWLAQRTLSSEPGNLPAVTGASGPRILGAIHPV